MFNENVYDENFGNECFKKQLITEITLNVQ